MQTAEELPSAIVNETQSILDSTRDSAAALKSELGPADRAMLSDYLDSVREIERRVQKQKEKENLQVSNCRMLLPASIRISPNSSNTMFELMAPNLPGGECHADLDFHDGEGSQHAYV